ncbi:MAG: protein kinase [Chthoniobacteraceae bacterium]|jgi:serine/threonine protein kinase/TPR repeat protein
MAEDLDFGVTIQGFAPGQKLSRRYSLNRTLGEGGMGVVWLVRDEELKRDIAMKFLPEMVVRDREAIADLKRETNRSLELTHANIVRIYDFVHEGNWAGISMEYVDGDTLSALKIDRPSGCFDVEEISGWMEQLCEALAYAHEDAQVVHRDLKPSNLMVTRTGKLKITDFGIAGTLTESVSRVSVKQVSGGTLVYMSPQQAMGEHPSVTDDIYSLGATIFDLLAGKPPFYSGDVITQVREKIPASMAEHRERLGITGKLEIPPHWEDTIAKCLKKTPAERPQSAREVGQLLFHPATVTAPRISIPNISGTITRVASTIKFPTMPRFPTMPKLETLTKLPSIPAIPAAQRQKLIPAAGAAVVLIAAVIGISIYLHRPKPIPVPPKPVAQATPTAAPVVAANPTVAPKPAVAAAPTAAPAVSAAPVVKSTPATPVVATASVAPQKPAASPTPSGPTPQQLEAMDATSLLNLAESGNAAAQGQLALWYGAGYKVALDYKQSFQWAAKASDAGDPVGQFAAALCYWTGNGIAQNKDMANQLAGKAVLELAPLAAKDAPAASYCLAKAYQQGLGAGQDQAKALALFQKQADEGNAMAQYEAGLMYAEGEGTAKGTAKATQLLQSAADQKLPDAMLALALLDQSAGTSHSQATAITLWQQAADAGSVTAQVGLGRMYLEGAGVDKDLAKAEQLFEKAAAQGNAAALYGLGWMCAAGVGMTQDLDKAAGYYQDAAVQGYAPANTALALMYAAGNGVTEDASKATDFYQKAAASPDAGEGSVLSNIAPGLSELLASGTGASSEDDSPPTVDTSLAATWETTSDSDDSDEIRWQISRTGKYTLSGQQDQTGAVNGFEGNLQQITSDGKTTELAYGIDGSTLETYGPDGLTKWRRLSTRRSSSSSGGSSGGGIKAKLKHIFTFGHD